MLSVVIKAPTLLEMRQQMEKATLYADLLELRLDHLIAWDWEELYNLRHNTSLPLIFTMRAREEGGHFKGSEFERRIYLRTLATLQPDYLDLESSLPSSFIEEIAAKFPKIKLILSYHNFSETPADLAGIYRKMKEKRASFYKMALMAHHCLDTMRFLCWAKEEGAPLIAISMGSAGQWSRPLGPLIGSPITYAALHEEDPAAPGQFSAETLAIRYRFHSLHPSTALYGLIGDPVHHSISDQTHNHLFGAVGLDALYVKVRVKSEELAAFLPLAKQLSFRGLSVTMPLKEEILSLLDEIASEAMAIGAVNTLHFNQGLMVGSNSDGRGAIEAIERVLPLKNQRVVILGAGGAARAIAYHAQKKGAYITLLNRDRERAISVAKQLGCQGGGLEQMSVCYERGYDLLVNGTPLSLPITPEQILPKAVIMDIVTKPKESLLLQLAKKKGCPIIYGYEMFIEQALGQCERWFGEDFESEKGREHLTFSSLKALSETAAEEALVLEAKLSKKLQSSKT